MQIKRFEAKNMTTALRMIKDELGSDAVILSARSLRKGKGLLGSLKHAGVEVSAAIDYQVSSAEGKNYPMGNETYSDRRKHRSENSQRFEDLQTYAPTGYSAQGRPYRRRADSDLDFESGGKHKSMSTLYQQILAQEVDRSIASELIEELKQSPRRLNFTEKGVLKSLLATAMAEMGLATDTHGFEEENQKISAFVGPTGVGKTTTIAKLAAYQVSRRHKQVALITVDNYSIAAAEQLRAYARILEIPLETAVNTAELKAAIRKFRDKDLILIDSPGVNPKSRESIGELATLFSVIPKLQTHLVLSASTKEKDLSAAAKAFNKLGIHRLLFTKVDESTTSGNILNVLIKSEIPLSFLCRGRKVPDDIEPGSLETLIDLLLEGQGTGPASAAHPDFDSRSNDQTYFLANKNSDVYHRFDCKWSKKIKFENIIKFSSSQMAEAQNFLPCSSCKPDRLQDDNHPETGTNKLKQSGYRYKLQS